MIKDQLKRVCLWVYDYEFDSDSGQLVLIRENHASSTLCIGWNIKLWLYVAHTISAVQYIKKLFLIEKMCTPTKYSLRWRGEGSFPGVSK